MSGPSQARLRGCIRRWTTLQPVPDLPSVRLYTGADVMELLVLTGEELGIVDPPLPFWAFPWAGGLGVARHVAEHPEIVAGRSVLDLATGSGLCGIVALHAGAATVQGADIDPFAEAAVTLNTRANNVEMAMTRRDLLDEPPPVADVVLAGDVLYEEPMARRMLPWLARAAAAGSTVLLGDPGRTYLPPDLDRVGGYRVRTTRQLESTEVREVGVYRMGPA